MMNMAIESPLSPLDQIRQTEAEVMRKVVNARESTGKVVQEAGDQAAETLKRAHIEGEQAGQAQYKETLAKSEEEAKALVVEATQRAEKLRQRGKLTMDALVWRIVQFVSGMEADI